MRHALIGIAWLAATGVASADGGAVRFSEVRDGRRITVFTAPTPLRAGPVDVSVLVQDAATGKPLLDVPVVVSAWPIEQADRRMGVPATTEAATNKLLRAASIDFSSAGQWHLEVSVQGSTPVGFDVEVDAAPPAWLDMAWWIGWPFAAIAFFAIHQCWTRSRLPFSARSSPRDITVSSP